MKSRKRAFTAAALSAALGLGAFAALVGGIGTAQADTTHAAKPAAAAAATSGGVKIAYYDQWSVYGNAFYPKNLDTEGIAGKLDVLNYSFENIDPTNLTCFEATKASDATNEQDPNAGDGAGDAFADYQKSFGSDISVNGTADVWNQPIVGNFNQLKELKAKYPNLKIVASIGGWTYSKYFSDVAATDAGRKKFVSSCIDMFIKGNLPVQGGYGGTGSAAGIFDGFDIDWEYPGSPGGHVGNHYSAGDTADYTALLAEFRSELNAYGSANGGKHMLLTAALPAGQDKISKIQTNQIGQYLDYANIMTYDMHGAFETTGPTNHQAPLYQSPSDPSAAISPGTEKYSADNAIKAWTTGDSAYGIPGGMPANKVTMGYPLYYRGWSGVPAGSNNGLYQSATGPASARGLSADRGHRVLQGTDRDRRQRLGHLLGRGLAVQLLLQRQRVLDRSGLAADPGRRGLRALPRPGRLDDVLAAGPGQLDDAAQQDRHRHQRLGVQLQFRPRRPPRPRRRRPPRRRRRPPPRPPAAPAPCRPGAPRRSTSTATRSPGTATTGRPSGGPPTNSPAPPVNGESGKTSGPARSAPRRT